MNDNVIPLRQFKPELLTKQSRHKGVLYTIAFDDTEQVFKWTAGPITITIRPATGSASTLREAEQCAIAEIDKVFK